MNQYEERLATFKNNPWPLSNNPMKKFSIELFAAAGFYFSPSDSHPDATSCYLCSKDLDGWEPEDDPWEAHIKHGRMPKKIVIRLFSSLLSASAEQPEIIKRTINYHITKLKSTGEEIPCPLTTLNLERSRIFSFINRWPQKQGKFIATPLTLASSGFFYYPSPGSNDQVVCYQCGLALNGWEPEDDPWTEHLKRRPDCPHIKGAPQEPYAFISIFTTSPPGVATKVQTDTSLELLETPKQRKHQHPGSLINARHTKPKVKNTPVSATKIKEIVKKTRESLEKTYIDAPFSSVFLSRESGPIKKPYCSAQEFETLSNMTVGSYLDWIGEEIMHAYDKIVEKKT